MYLRGLSIILLYLREKEREGGEGLCILGNLTQIDSGDDLNTYHALFLI